MPRSAIPISCSRSSWRWGLVGRCRRRRRRSGSSGAGAGRPAVAGGHRRVPGQRVGRDRAAQGDRVEGPLRPRPASRPLHHRRLVQARPGRGLDQGPQRRAGLRAVRPLPPAQLRPLLRPDRLLLPAGRGPGRGRRPVRHDHAAVPGRYAIATVIKEVRDRGVIWKDYAHGVRRGREMVLWGGLQAGNYMYLMSYSFHDDGTIALRVGATGQNLPGQRQEAHVHSAHWRIDMDLVDGRKNSAMLMRHVEDPHEPGRRGHQGPLQRRHGRRRQLGPQGIHDDPRGVREEERARRDDRLRPDAPAVRHAPAQRAVHPPRPLGQPGASGTADGVPVHQPAGDRQGRGDRSSRRTSSSGAIRPCTTSRRNEDGMPGGGRRLWPGDDAWEGSALVMWSGVDLRPRNLFDRTPFYPYTPPPPPRQAMRGPGPPTATTPATPAAAAESERPRHPISGSSHPVVISGVGWVLEAVCEDVGGDAACRRPRSITIASAARTSTPRAQARHQQQRR